MTDEIYMNTVAYRMDAKWWSNDQMLKERVVNRLAQVLESSRQKLILARTYRSLRWDSDFIVWTASQSPDDCAYTNQLVSEASLGYAQRVFGLYSIYDESPYLKPGVTLADTLRQEPLRYMIAYPMSKSSEWYQISFEERKKIMAEHIGMARSHPMAKGVRSYTTYSFGLGDQEFVVLYEAESLAAWSKVTEKLREAKARTWIVQETPIYVGVIGDLQFLTGTRSEPQSHNAIV